MTFRVPIANPMKKLILALLAIVLTSSSLFKADKNIHLSIQPELESYIQESVAAFGAISKERKSKIQEIAEYLNNEHSSPKIQLTFICTHNSRRSHLSQIWAQTAADWYQNDGVTTFSGGTESTAFNPRAVAALERAGFLIDKGEGDNPKYLVATDSDAQPMTCFSKKYSHPENPQNDFIAVMTCSDADKKCPVVSGAEARFSLPFIDPKVSDGTAEEEETYDLRCRQISVEMLYLMSLIAQK